MLANDNKDCLNVWFFYIFFKPETELVVVWLRWSLHPLLVYMVYRPRDLYESDSSPCVILEGLCFLFNSHFKPKLKIYDLNHWHCIILQQAWQKCSLNADLPNVSFCVEWKFKMVATSELSFCYIRK